MPEKIGVASLVPPTISQPGAPAPAKDQYTQAPPLTAADIEMSGVPRWLPTTFLTPVWKSGREKTPDSPPPPAPKPSFHTTSGDSRLPALSRESWEPPTEVTSGSDDGQESTRYGHRV